MIHRWRFLEVARHDFCPRSQGSAPRRLPNFIFLDSKVLIAQRLVDHSQIINWRLLHLASDHGGSSALSFLLCFTSALTLHHVLYPHTTVIPQTGPPLEALPRQFTVTEKPYDFKLPSLPRSRLPPCPWHFSAAVTTSPQKRG